MASWTKIMGLAAVLGIILSVVGVWLIWQTFAETRRAANASQNALISFREAERGQIVVNLKTGEKSTTSNLIHFSPVLKNIGRSPVKVLRVRSQSLTEPRLPEKFSGGNFSEFYLDAGSIHTVRINGYDNTKRYPYIGGYVVYRCRFGLEHRTYYCFEITTNSHLNTENYNTHWARPAQYERDWPQDT
ncbi:hypothetical protein C8024_07030 [Sphingopyxis sp. BSNA05]|nr:hypothetical protein [Sphingopyxis sp. BSNA05]